MATTITSLLKPKGVYSYTGSIWMNYDGERCFGPGKLQLLEGIHKTGSINKAAKEMGMSYKKAWQMVATLNEQFSSPMIITQSGGKGGGGSIISAAAKKLIVQHQHLRKKFAEFLQAESAKLTKQAR